MLINRWGRKYARWWREKKEEKKRVSDRNLSDGAHREIKKSQSLRRHTRAQIACGICYKSFDLKRVAFDIKEKKLGQFSICYGSKRDPSFFFFDKGGGQALSP